MINPLLQLFVALFIVGCSQLFYWPTQQIYSDPKEHNLDYEDVFFPSLDGTELHGWYFKQTSSNQKAKGLVVLFHGNAQNITSHYVQLLWILERGYDFFVFDYRGYGKSQGSPNQQGLYKDALAALDFAHQTREQNELAKLVAYSQSLGGAVLARALEDDPKIEEIDLVVFDSTFSSYTGIAHRKLENSALSWLSFLAKILISNEYSAQESLSKLENPTLVVHAKDDNVVEYENAKDLYALLTMKDKWFWTLKSRHHISTFFIEEGRYRDKFITLLESLPSRDKQ